MAQQQPAVLPTAPSTGPKDEDFPAALDKGAGTIIDQIMVVKTVDEIPPLSQKAADLISSPLFQNRGLDAQMADIRDNVRLHGELKAILLQIEATEWGADGAALAALSEKAAALITPEVTAKPQLAATVSRIQTDVGAAINAKKPAA